MSKFPNQLAVVGVIGVSAIALAVGMSERAAHKAEEAAHAAETHAAATVGSVVEHEAAAEEVAEAPAEAQAPQDLAAAAPGTAAPEAGGEAGADAEPIAEVASEEAPEATPAAGEAALATAAAVVDGATDKLDGQGDTLAMTGEDTAAAHGRFGLGRPALPEEVAAWNRDIMPDGTGLPVGEGSVEDGDMIFSENCAVCHGDFAEGVDNWPKLAGGMDTLDHEDPLKTVGSYWPYLSTTFDYVRRSMPFGNAQTLQDDEVYAIVAYILYSNDLVDEDFVLSNETFLDVEMPNANGFLVDDRPEAELALFSQDPCMENCKDAVEITMRAAVLDVTPQETRAKTIQKLIEVTDPNVTRQKAAAPAVEEAPDAAEAPAAEQAPTGTEAAPAEAEAPAPAAQAAGPDPELVAAGEKVFKKCKACHQVGDGAKNRVGPVLNGVVGRHAGSGEGFKYSSAMSDAGAGGLVWTEETLAEYLADPKGYLKGNRMSFAGLKKAEDSAAVIAYLKAHP